MQIMQQNSKVQNADMTKEMLKCKTRKGIKKNLDVKRFPRTSNVNNDAAFQFIILTSQRLK
jgi:hypothetical protein